MSATEFLCRTIGIDPRKLSKEENLILEAELYSRICNQVINSYEDQYKNYFFLLNDINTKEDDINMTDLNFLRSLIYDLLRNDTYTLSGIACYTQTPQDVIEELVIGSHSSPVLNLSRKLIELHRSLYPDLYRNILKKAIAEPAL